MRGKMVMIPWVKNVNDAQYLDSIARKLGAQPDFRIYLVAHSSLEFIRIHVLTDMKDVMDDTEQVHVETKDVYLNKKFINEYTLTIFNVAYVKENNTLYLKARHFKDVIE
mgnify:CR=1 FL=1